MLVRTAIRQAIERGAAALPSAYFSVDYLDGYLRAALDIAKATVHTRGGLSQKEYDRLAERYIPGDRSP